METLKIKNFLCIEEAEIEIKKINLFIGQQAQGKSVIAKLIYFFKEYPKTILTYVFQGSNKLEVDKKLVNFFEKIFPLYTWNTSEFSIVYSNKYYTISAINLKSEKGIFNFSLYNSKNFDDAFLSVIHQKKENNIIFESGDFDILVHQIIKNLFCKNKLGYIEQVDYIPAGRSFFATLQKNIFSVISYDISIDFFLKQFGINYSIFKNNKVFSATNEVDLKIKLFVEKIMGGQYLFDNEQDWIVNKGGKVNLIDASSGQQEFLPIAVMLAKNVTIPTIDYMSIHSIVEEPEAHLFPTAQSEIISLIALICNENIKNTFTITTHSPYILTAFNNLIQAGNVAASKNYQNLEELYKVVPKDEIVDFNDVSAYLVNNGTVQSILDNELKLIDATMIDSVSRQFANTFEQLVIMEDEHD